MLSAVLACLFISMTGTGCGRDEASHLHPPGEHGGFIVALGRDHYHAEILFTDGELRLFVLGEDESRIVDVVEQEIEVYLRPFGDARSRTVVLKPTPQSGDPEGRTSLFAGTLPDDLPSLQVLVTVPMIQVEGQRYRFSFATSEPLMPGKISDAAEQDLYLTPGGLYTEDDIAANGVQTASEKFKGFVSKHNMHPTPGSRICPVTETAANAECSWIIGGEEYLFCCPPCVDEFVRRAKTEPDAIRPAATYVKKADR